ncbi:MAG: sugar ABC transporter permease [Chloroflexi bacterium]|nr:sugar ABC transporter permease [Chloroflexota bacterium]
MKLRLSQKNALWGFAFIALPVIYFLFIFIVPMVQAFYFSVLNYNTLSTQTHFIGLANYASMLEDDVFWTAIWNSLRYALVRAPGVLLISLITALLFQNITRGKGFLQTLIMLPFMTSGVAMAWIFNLIYSRIGPITALLSDLGVQNPQLLTSPKTALYAIAAVTIWGSIGYYALLFTVGLNAIPNDYYDAAKVDGASPWQIFKHITIPLLNPTIVLVSIIAVTASLKNFDVVRSMAANGGPINSTLTLPLMIYLEAFRRMNMGRASAMTLVFFLFILIITFIQLKLITREVRY